MLNKSRSAMAELLRLTQSGQLAEVTARIQAALTGRATPEPASAPPPGVVLVLKPIRPAIFSPLDAPANRPGKSSGPASQPALSGRFEERTYSGATGKLAYWLYKPAGFTDGMPLVVMLHGCTQSPEDFAQGTGMNRLADELGFMVAYPGQSRSANAQKCWNWFKPGDQRRDSGEPALIAGVTGQVIAEQRADPARVYVAGLSAGGAAATIMGATYPDIYAAIGVHSGLACGAARDLPGALAAMRGGGTAPAGGGAFVPVITFHGDRDTTVHEINSRTIIAAASAATAGSLQTHIETEAAGGGRRYTREVSVDREGRHMIEQWTVHGGGHAWSGGDSSGSYTDPSGPDASREMVRFFLSHKLMKGKGRAR